MLKHLFPLFLSFFTFSLQMTLVLISWLKLMLSSTTMRLLDKVPIRRVSDRPGQSCHTSDNETSNTLDYPNFKPHNIHRTLERLNMQMIQSGLFIIIVCCTSCIEYIIAGKYTALLSLPAPSHSQGLTVTEIHKHVMENIQWNCSKANGFWHDFGKTKHLRIETKSLLFFRYNSE